MYYLLQITPREQNAHAEVNSAFLFKFDPHTNHIEKASIVYGGINPSFTHAYKTEHFLLGKYIFNNEVLQSTLRCLHNEINPNVNPPDPTPHFRHKLALSLFYKVKNIGLNEINTLFYELMWIISIVVRLYVLLGRQTYNKIHQGCVVLNEWFENANK